MINNVERVNASLIAFSVFCICLSIGRVIITDYFTFLFLPWNLLLAWIPYLISIALYRSSNKAILIIAGIIWLAFFPNAPYIVTDLLHLQQRESIPLWYDVCLLVSFSVTGLILGLLSLRLVALKLQTIIHPVIAHCLIALVVLASSYGVYMGRFWRWNSWDLAFNLNDILAQTFHVLTTPSKHLPVFAFVIVFSAFTALCYTTLCAVIEKENNT